MKYDPPIFFAIIVVIFLLLLDFYFDTCHRVPACPLCDEQAIKCNVNEGRTMLRCANNHIWYQ